MSAMRAASASSISVAGWNAPSVIAAPHPLHRRQRVVADATYGDRADDNPVMGRGAPTTDIGPGLSLRPWLHSVVSTRGGRVSNWCGSQGDNFDRSCPGSKRRP
jgi:hypothetical protein